MAPHCCVPSHTAGGTPVTQNVHPAQALGLNEGDAHVAFRVADNVGTQLISYRVTDVATGASTVHLLTVSGTPSSASQPATAIFLSKPPLIAPMRLEFSGSASWNEI